MALGWSDLLVPRPYEGTVNMVTFRSLWFLQEWKIACGREGGRENVKIYVQTVPKLRQFTSNWHGCFSGDSSLHKYYHIPVPRIKVYGDVKEYLHSSLTSALDIDEWSTSRRGRITLEVEATRTY
jgi:hypothetical protein